MAGKPDTRELAHEAIGSARLTPFGVSLSRLSRRHTPVVAIRAFRTGFRDDFRFCRHLFIPATAIVFLLFPLWGILHPHGRTLMDLLPFAALGWLCLGVVVASTLRTRRLAESPAPG
jgi:hypothetical protein